MGYEDLISVARSFQAVGLLGENVRVARKKKKRVRDFIHLGATNVVGSSLISSSA